MYFRSNLKRLRKRKKLSQEETSRLLEIPRSTLSGYENGVAQPGFDTLVKISECFNVELDTLLKVDLSAWAEEDFREMESSGAKDLAGKNLRVLAVTVDNDDKENIELVPEKAKAGYTTGYSNPEFVGLLSKFQLPFLGRTGTYRTFQISGDSMPPVKHGYWVTGKYIDDWHGIKNGRPYILVTQNDGVVFKLVYSRIEESSELQLVSTNPEYEPYNIPVDDVLEIWEFVHSINTDFEP